LVIWITGLSGAGKTTLSKQLYTYLREKYINTILLDGDILRGVLSDFDYTLDGRLKGAKQIHNLCMMLEQQGMIVVCATMSLFKEIHKLNREKFLNYLEVFIDVDMHTLIQRDSKQLYSRALEGKEKNVVGIDLSFDIPKNADLILQNNVELDISKNINTLLKIIEQKIK
jgi:adenylylsulfate kinase-like enzyme